MDATYSTIPVIPEGIPSTSEIATTSEIVPNPTTGSSKKASYIIIIVTIVLAIIIIGILIYFAATQTGIFKPYVPQLSSVYWKPGGDVIYLTPEQIQQRQAALAS